MILPIFKPALQASLFNRFFSWAFVKSLTVVCCVAIVFWGESVAYAEMDAVANIKAALKKSLPKVNIISVKASPVAGMYVVMTDGGELLHVDTKAEYIFSGDLYHIAPGGLENLSEPARSDYRSELVKSIDMSQTISYAPSGDSRGEILVFTDTDCGYCRKLHGEVPALLKAGVTVHYLAWPRKGVMSSTGQTMKNIWCASDPQQAMNLAKMGQPVSQQEDCQPPIAKHLALGLKLGVSGTPAVFTRDGQQLGGYLPAQAIIERLGLK